MSEKEIDLTPVPNMKCPICGKETVQHYKPFCSKRCADVDLSRWFNEGYVIHTDETPDTMQGE